MRAWFAAALILTFLAPAAMSAASTPVSTIHLARPVIQPGQTETITLTARDLDGRPLAHARVSAFARYGKSRYTFHPPRTNARGQALLLFRTTAHMKNVSVTVSASITNGYISIPLTARFAVRSSTAPSPTSTPSPTPKPTKTRVSPTSTPVSATAGASLSIVARAVPPQVTAPDAIWVVAYVHDSSGNAVPGADVQAAASFSSGRESTSGLTDAQGVAMVSFDTGAVHASQAVDVHLVVSSGSATVSSDATALLTVPPPPPTATDPPTPTATASPTPTDPPVSDQPTATPVPTDTPQPTATDTPAPTATATQASNCPGSQSGCMQALLNILNGDRASYAQQYGLNIPPLTLNTTESAGTSSCLGAYGHSTAMAQTGQIWHVYPGDTNDTNPASFPNNFCVAHFPIGQNVGMAHDGNELQDLNVIDTEMLTAPGEEHDPGFCGQYALPPNHACSIVSTKYQQVGLGIYVDAGGTTWVTEDFLGY
jgi:uncharacterized protein YkwD